MILNFEMLDGWSRVPAYCAFCDKYLIYEKNVFQFLNNWCCESCADSFISLSLKEVPQ